jgi:hypothetical protein
MVVIGLLTLSVCLLVHLSLQNATLVVLAVIIDLPRSREEEIAGEGLKRFVLAKPKKNLDFKVPPAVAILN